MIRAVIVDDEAPAREALRELLNRHADVQVVAEHAFGHVAKAILDVQADVAFVDVRLRHGDGFSLVEQLRLIAGETPLCVFVTGTGSQALRAFDVNAFDYVLKPLDVDRLDVCVQRLRDRLSMRAVAALASEPAVAQPRIRVVGDIVIDEDRRTVTRGGKLIQLSRRAFDLLVALARAEGRVVTREDLLRSVWLYEPGIQTRTVDMHVVELRQKLEQDSGARALIVTVRSLGYRLAG
ncbi:MAG: response regulator receiver [Gemmatimonadetes bacterium]|nr:response regulator receiver [Gemmatimonadota bacterium]